MIVDIFIPCIVDQFYPQTGFNMIKILEKLNIAVHYNQEQTCCGKTAFDAGFWDEAKEIGDKFILDFPNNRPIVSPTAACVSMVRNNYGELFYNSALHNEYRQIQKNMYEFTEFLVKVLKVTDVGAEFNAKVTYHESCSSLRGLGANNEARQLLKNVKGLELVEMKDREVCCGAGGMLPLKNEAISSAMAEQKVLNAIDTGAEYIVSTDLSCLMHQESYAKKNNLPIKIIHIIDVLASGW
ncbi:MAG: Fe-S oxidoreductase [Bacteroidetes bacterium HGW-Bacteroidetes-17]|jgi:L-lactate dehydrogenase complex protein LldE|nr:MAG: Fe-S oxidoreductase [Bacteroidetes bacterium HGW-Bacteroidetes-17]